MKKKKFGKNLTLDKITVANLSVPEMKRQRAGGPTVQIGCGTEWTHTCAGPILTCVMEACFP